MMRRTMASVLMLSMFQLTVLEVRAECDRHAAAAKQDATATTPSQADHSHHADHAPANAPPSDAQDAPVPKCCMVAGTCNVGAFATIVRVSESTDATGATTAARIASLPQSRTLAPEPPPPKA
jgi:hypothetical protein